MGARVSVALRKRGFHSEIGNVFGGGACADRCRTGCGAGHLFNQTNMPQQFVTPQNLTFTATSASTVINFQGYQLPGTVALVNLFLAPTGTPLSTANNLLGLHYA